MSFYDDAFKMMTEVMQKAGIMMSLLAITEVTLKRWFSEPMFSISMLGALIVLPRITLELHKMAMTMQYRFLVYAEVLQEEDGSNSQEEDVSNSQEDHARRHSPIRPT